MTPGPPKKAIAYCELLKAEYETLGDAEGMAGAFYDWGNYYYYTGYYAKALDIIQERLELHYKGRASFSIESEQGRFFLATLTVPCDE